MGHAKRPDRFSAAWGARIEVQGALIYQFCATATVGRSRHDCDEAEGDTCFTSAGHMQVKMSKEAHPRLMSFFVASPTCL